MKTMPVSEFKAKCLAVLKEVQRTREPLLITLHGEPLAILQPVEPPGAGKRLGGLKGRMTIRRDLVKFDTTRDWDMLRMPH
jgi:prevent-host-death family protein